jgi:hypothetical protein
VSVTEQSLRPPYPLAEMVTWELTEYRRELERVLGLPELPPIYLPREQLQKQLDAVVAEQAERARIRHAKPEPESADA